MLWLNTAVIRYGNQESFRDRDGSEGVVLAGGTGSRLFPLTRAINKHLLPVGRYPMILHPIARLKQAGIYKILIVTGRRIWAAWLNCWAAGGNMVWNLPFGYRKSGRNCQALGLAEDFIQHHRLIAILGDNIFSEDISPFIAGYLRQETGAKILLKQVEQPQRFGVVELEGNRITGIEEKPLVSKSSFAVTGIYMYDKHVFEVIRSLKPSDRGELEITDVNNHYIHIGQMTYDILEGWWTDAGTFSSWKDACRMTWDWELPL